ncbi:hypothetical protein D1818_02020 [Aquimarina sp. BL5]|uniref:hypothetical protein n=1 Tax=Aquimarina sp. BL5 TaxID=1714860 RepID=UPI000E5243BE|nr:hypothetical protein [Aquimarina sp. BL5]AXT49655.1 hypothetical protein D1818_02020 [Aquimarina sp. BL5]RKN00866.1 hypothetical protein D7036_18190 [Aquimarina sp. BL5]
MKNVLICIIVFTISASACSKDNDSSIETDISIPEVTAGVTSVSVTGQEDNYTFSVEIKSPDLGCNQYADWWEIVSEDGRLLYRRILAHSHVNEQPFTRSGGPVNIAKDEIVYIRAHMNNKGYGDVVFKGSVSAGFNQETLETTFASELETTAPLPNGCAF